MVKMLYTFDIETYEITFWNEIWGCVKYIRIPYDTVMNMPIQDRKIWIQKHNMDSEREQGMENDNNRGGNINGGMINSFAKLEQTKK